MREIVIDTETTGLDPHDGHRMVEIACIELMHHVPSGRKFHRYVNPERDMPADAFAVHGLSAEFLAEHTRFAEIADELLDFIGDDQVVIHNAEFDLAFLNAELARLGRPALACRVHRYARGGAPALSGRAGQPRRAVPTLRDRSECAREAWRRYRLRPAGLGLSRTARRASAGARSCSGRMGDAALDQDGATLRAPRPPRPHRPTEEELAAHQAMLAAIKSPLWLAAASG